MIYYKFKNYFPKIALSDAISFFKEVISEKEFGNYSGLYNS